MRISHDGPAFRFAGRLLNFDDFLEDPRGVITRLIKRLLGMPDETARLFGSAAGIDALTIYDIVLRIYADTSSLEWNEEAVAGHLSGLVDTGRDPAAVRGKMELLELAGDVRSVAAEMVVLAGIAPETARAALDGRLGRAIDLLPKVIRDDGPFSRKEIRKLLARVGLFWAANDLRLIHHYTLRRAASPFGDRILDNKGKQLSLQHKFLYKLWLPVARRTLSMFVRSPDDRVHGGRWVLLLQSLKRPGEWLERRWEARYGQANLIERLRAAAWIGLDMLDDLDAELRLVFDGKTARNTPMIVQKSVLRYDYDANLLLYLAALVAAAWSQAGQDEDHQSTGLTALEEALAVREGASRGGKAATVRTPRPNALHYPTARKLVAVARWTLGNDDPALPVSMQTLNVDGVEHTVTKQAEVMKARGTAYTLAELVDGILADEEGQDSSVSRGAQKMLHPKEPLTPGQQWMLDFAQGSLAWRINDC